MVLLGCGCFFNKYDDLIIATSLAGLPEFSSLINGANGDSYGVEVLRQLLMTNDDGFPAGISC